MKKVIILTESEVCKAITEFVIRETKAKKSSIVCVYDMKRDESMSDVGTGDFASVEMVGA